MRIKLYNTKSENNKLHKLLTEIQEIENAKILNQASIINLTITIKRDLVSDFTNVNYVYIDNFSRYYFVEDVKIENGFLILNCRCDVLMSHREQISNIYCTIARNQNQSNGYLYDNNYKVLSYENIVCKQFPNGLTTNGIILMTAG